MLRAIEYAVVRGRLGQQRLQRLGSFGQFIQVDSHTIGVAVHRAFERKGQDLPVFIVAG